MHLTFCSYRVIKGTNGYKLFEDVNQPFGPKYDCVVVPDNLSDVMIVFQQSDDVILIFNEAKFADNAFKLIKFQVMYIFSSQSLYNLLEVEPPEKQISKFNLNLFSQFFQS